MPRSCIWIRRACTSRSISSFGESESKELYAVDLINGKLYLVVAPPYADITNSFFYYDTDCDTYLSQREFNVARSGDKIS